MLMEKNIHVNDVSVQDFTRVLSECRGDVYMVTAEGDRLNLKSRLCQLLGFAELIRGGTIAGASLECSDKEDEARLFRLNLFGTEN